MNSAAMRRPASETGDAPRCRMLDVLCMVGATIFFRLDDNATFPAECVIADTLQVRIGRRRLRACSANV